MINMDYFYLSDNIFIKEDKTYIIKNNKEVLIKNNNWHKLLKDIGWTKLSTQWIKKLSKLSTNKKKKSTFGIIDCGSDGDCFFHCISFALNSVERYKSDPIIYNAHDIKSLLVNSIDIKTFNDIIEIYKILKDQDELEEYWNPYNTTFDEFKEMILNKENIFWGDHILIQLIIKVLNINVIILNNDTYSKEYNVYNTMIEYDLTKNTIILMYDNNNHFRLVGYYKDNLILSLFEHRSIPDEIKILINT